jgi:polar amino acid transport system substrate-binding protein
MIVGVFLFFQSALAQAYCDEPFTITTSYNDLLCNLEQTGLLDRLMTALFGRLGLSMRLVFIPTEKALVDVNAGLFDAELNRIKGMESSYPNLIQVPEPNMTMHFVAFSTRNIKIDGWNSIKPLNIGLVRGWKILEANTSGFPEVIKTPSEKELFTMLHKNRLDVALYSKITGYAAIERMGYKDIFHLEPPLASRPMYLYIHKKNENMVTLIANELKLMKKDGSYQAIMTAEDVTK